MKHICIDIETMGHKYGSAIIAIGAVQFDLQSGKTGEMFYTNIDLDSCIKAGLTMDPSTVLWWMKQSDEARKSLENIPYQLEHALTLFEAWMQNINSTECQIWANSPSFDLNLLECAFSKFGMKAPWFYWQERDCRTLVAFNPELKKSIINDLPHDAISDCLYQIKYCSAIYNSININI